MQSTVASTPQVRRLGVAVTIASLAAIGIATLFPDPDPPVASHFCLICGSRGGVDAVLNVLLFLPLGVGLGLAGIRARFTLPGMAALSALIETAQLFLIAGRDASVGDLLANTGGGALGFAISMYAIILIRPSPRTALWLTAGWCMVWLAIQAISSFALAPAIPESEYYGQIAPRLERFQLFRGRVIAAHIANTTIPDSRVDDSHKMQRLILGGAPIKVTVAPAGRTQEIAPIVRIADTQQREIVLLAQNDDDIVFGVRTGASVLRLRPPFFSLPRVFSADLDAGSIAPGDAVSVTGRYVGGEASLSARSRSASFERRIAVTPSLGWTLMMPFQWLIEGTRAELALSLLWVALVIAPIGYWSARALNFSNEAIGSTLKKVLPLAIALLYSGLVLLPLGFGVSPSAPRDWLAAAVGLLVGGGVARMSVPGEERDSDLPESRRGVL